MHSITILLSYLVTLKLGVVQLLQSVLHVLPTEVLHHPGAVLEHVGVADVARVPHVVLQVLPAASGWQAADYHAVLGSVIKVYLYIFRLEFKATCGPGVPFHPCQGLPLLL